MAKGIRVNQLAKELGVESKAILAKCREEGLGEKVPNHMSVLTLGLAETVREWFSAQSGGGGGTAVETAAPVDVAIKKAVRRRKKAEAEAPPEEPAPPVTEEAVPETLAEKSVKEKPKRRPPTKPVEAPVVEAPVEPVAPVAEAPPPAEAPAVVVVEPPEAPPADAPVAPVAPVAPPAVAAEAPKPAPADTGRTQQPRPTITLANRTGAPTARKPITPAPKLTTLEPAKIQGPRVVREEKPEVVPTPRARRPGGPGAAEPPAFTQARPQAGRGVKVTDDDEETEAKKKAAKGARTLSLRRRGPDGRRGEAMEKLKEYTEADLIERRDRLAAAGIYRTGFDSHLKKSSERGQHVQAKTGVQLGEPIEVEEPITVKSLSAVLGIKASDIISKLMKQGVFATINQSLDRSAAEAIALEYGIELRIKQQATLEEELVKEFEQRPREEAQLISRPPVVTILGHVDHGKTSLLDKIRNANVAAGEAGGITQHTAAWTVQVDGEGGRRKRVTFIDTPGHQAFTSMRARGAHMTDVVVLVVGAAEGVQPQTLESINHARAAGVPIVVALNKIDRPDANPDMVLGQLAKENLNPVEWGGDTEVVRTSALTGQGIKELIEILDYQSELLELKADPSAPARGVVIESRVDEGMGAVATILVQDGTLRVGDVVLCGPGHGRVRSLVDDRGKAVEEAGPATPVIVSGLNVLPNAGDKFYAVEDDMERARSIAEERGARMRQSHLAVQNRVTADNLLSTIAEGDVKTIHLIIKADVQGSVETLMKSVTDMNTEEVKVRVIHAGVGAVSESDVELAMATRINPEDPQEPRQVGIIGFHVSVEEEARVLAEQNHIDVKLYRVIYEIFDDLKKALSGMLAPEVREKMHGHAEIRQVFKVSRVGSIAGCMVIDGHIQRGSRLRLIRNSVVVTEDLSIETLRRVKDDVREVKQGFECGIKIANYDDIKVGDVLEAYVRETIQRTL